VAKKGVVYSLVIMLVCLALSGCAGSKGSDVQSADSAKPNEIPKASTEPMTLIVYGNVNKGPTDFDDFFVKPLKEKFPNITLKLIDKTAGGQPEELLASGTMPDIIYDSPPGILFYQKLDMIEDLDPYIKKYSVDMNRFEPTVVDMLKQYGNGKIFALPFIINFSALFYNKDIFDKFGVSYPKDGMTWDEAMELARKVSRSSDGVQYNGLEPGLVTEASGQLTLGFADPKTDKPVIDSEGWRTMFQFMQSVFAIPGNKPDKPRANPKPIRDEFFKNKALAMMGDWGINAVGQFSDMLSNGAAMNWDMATLPTFKQAPGVSRKIDSHLLFVSKGSKHKEEAFQIINYMVNDESELRNAKAGRLPAIVNPEIRKQFGVDVPALKGKNLKVVLNYKPAKQYPPSFYEDIAKSAVKDEYYNFVYTGQKDINTALREAQEAAEKEIATQKGN
jgi:multiple sugar transport system substrate-binding protein